MLTQRSPHVHRSLLVGASLRACRLMVMAMLTAAALLATACSDDDLAGRHSQGLQLQLNIGLSEFDANAAAATRAGSEWTWPDGAVLILQFHTSHGLERGYAVYNRSQGTWDGPSWTGQLAQADRCEVYYFVGADALNQDQVTLASYMASYADTLGTYSIDAQRLSVTATLRPLTSRVRFRGNEGLGITVYGMKYYTSYDAVTNTFTTSTYKVGRTVATSGYTSYIYGGFADPERRIMAISNTDDGDVRQFVRFFGDDALVVGESGYVIIPTDAANPGWDSDVVPNLSVASRNVTLENDGTIREVALSCQSRDISVTSSEEWLTARLNADQTAIILTPQPSTQSTTRTATVTVVAATEVVQINVTQKAADLKVNRATVSLNANGGTAEVNVITTLDYQISASHPWIILTPKADGSGFTIAADYNPSSSSRSGTVTVTADYLQRFISVAQLSGHLTVSTSSVEFGDEGGAIDINVNATLPFTATSSDSWVTAEADVNASQVHISVEAMGEGNARQAKVTISGGEMQATIDVRQDHIDPLGLCPSPSHPHYIDMGTGVLWSCCNIGAATPTEYGHYYAFGEVEPKDSYSWATYKWCEGSGTTITKYNASTTYGTVDNLSQLEAADDVCSVTLGSAYHLPTTTDITNLINDCTWTWTTLDGVQGSMAVAANGNKLFFPAAGSYGTVGSSSGTLGYYSSANRGSAGSYTYYLYIRESGAIQNQSYRYIGRSARAVTAK